MFNLVFTLGYVEFKYSEDVDSAIAVMDNGEIDGKAITVYKSSRAELREKDRRKKKQDLAEVSFFFYLLTI